MSQRVEGLYLRSTKINHNSLIAELFTKQFGRVSFIFSISSKKNKSYLFQPFHFIEFSTRRRKNYIQHCIRGSKQSH